MNNANIGLFALKYLLCLLENQKQINFWKLVVIMRKFLGYYY
jgi:hypothetical protein